MSKILSNLLINYNEMLNAVLSFTGVVLAIFFTLITLPIQNILGRYSQDLVKRVVKDWIFLASFFFLAVTFGYNLLLLALDKNYVLILFSLGSGIASLLVLFLLVIHIFYLLDIRNQVKDITKSIKKKIAPFIQRTRVSQEKKMEKIKTSISAEIKNSLVKFKVAPQVTSWLKIETEIIIDITQKAIQENRFEIVESGLKNIGDIIRGYISARKKYQAEQDEFLTYIMLKLIDMKDLVSVNSHPKIMSSIVNLVGEIAKETLNIRPIRAQFGENFIPLGFIDILKNIILSPEILKETSSAPIDACSQLVEIGKTAIDQEYPITANIVAEKLGEISRLTTKMHFLYGDLVSAKANWGIAYLLNYSLVNLEKIKTNRRIVLRSISKEINKSIKTYFEDDYVYTMRSNIAPFIGLMADHGIATIFVRAIQQIRKDKRDYSDVLELLEEFISDLNQNVLLGMEKERYFDIRDILYHTYAVSISLIGFITKFSEERLKQKAKEILESRIFYILYNPISMSFKQEGRRTLPYWKYLDVFSSIIGVMFVENKNNIFTNTIGAWVKEITEFIESKKEYIYCKYKDKKFENYEITHPLSKIFQHLRLIGSWAFKFIPNSELPQNIKKVLKAQPKITFKRKIIASYLIGGETELYPQSVTGDEWHIERPILPFNADYFVKLDNALFDLDNINKFEKFLENE